VRGARIVLADDLARARHDRLVAGADGLGGRRGRLAGRHPSKPGPDGAPPPRDGQGRYKRPYEGTDNAQAAMQAYLDWEFGLVDQLRRDGTHGFVVI
jgi:hypothetical protein